MTVSRKKQLSTLEILFAQRQMWSARDSQKTFVICFERATKRHDWNDNACDVTRKWPLSMSWHWESAVNTLLHRFRLSVVVLRAGNVQHVLILASIIDVEM